MPDCLCNQSFLLGLVESFGHFLPVYYLPDLLKEIGPGILVIEIVSMLPHVNSQQGNQRRVLVRYQVLVLGLSILESL